MIKTILMIFIITNSMFAQTITPHMGWNLLGAVEDIRDMKTMMEHSSNIMTLKGNKYMESKDIKMITKGEGFWFYAKDNKAFDVPKLGGNVGVFLDGEVEAMRYQCGMYSGYTSSNGEFSYEKGKPCEFMLGDTKLTIDMTKAQDSIVTPFNLMKTKEEALELARFMQAFSMIENGKLKLMSEKVANLGVLDFKNSKSLDEIVMKNNLKIVSKETSMSHLKESFNLDSKDGMVKIKEEKIKALKDMQKKKMQKNKAIQPSTKLPSQSVLPTAGDHSDMGATSQAHGAM